MKFLIFVLCANLFSATLEEKIGRMLIVHFEGEVINEDAKRLIDEAHVGGFCYYDLCNGASVEGLAQLSQDLQEYSKYPLLLCIDQEGGRVQRLNIGMPSAKEMNPAVWGAKAGEVLKQCGINLNLAPVLDLQMGSRSFSSDPLDAVARARSFIEHMDVMACVKHFPGHGNFTIDPHYGLPTVDFDIKNLAPFMALHAPFIMSAHVLIPQIDPTYCATLSKIWLTDILRHKLGYQGVVISDSLTMEGVIENAGTMQRAALLAINAGCDMLILGRKHLSGDPSKNEIITQEIIDLHHFLVNCVNDGLIEESKINNSFVRINS